MRWQTNRFTATAHLAWLASCALGFSFQCALAQQPAAAPAPQPATPGAQPPAQRGPEARPVDPRVQIRTYLFEDTKEQLPYALFVSSKVNPAKKSPLIVTLHGLG